MRGFQVSAPRRVMPRFARAAMLTFRAADSPEQPVTFSRSQPSPRYQHLMRQYGRMHVEGETHLGIPAAQTFPGSSLAPHVTAIKKLIQASDGRTILDYGAGKGLQYRPHRVMVEGRHVADGIAEYWDVDELRCYDPGYAPFATLPEGRFDGVVCTDVLEHCPEEDLPWIVAELFGFAKRFVYANVACYPARKRLPDGENAHVTLRDPQWWRELFVRCAAAHDGVAWELHADERSAVGMKDNVFRSGEPAPAQGAAPRIARIEIDGHEARFEVSNDMARWRVDTLFTKEPVTIEWLRGMPRGAVLYDIGANVGMYTVFAALAREARVLAFEPESQNYALLNRNIALNALESRVAAYCAAVSDATQADRLYLSDFEAGTSCHSFGEQVGHDLKPRPAAFTQGCLSIALDEWITDGRLPVPQYVKVDVDGFEHKALRGMAHTLRDARVRSLIVELNPTLAEHLALRDWLGTLGFRWDPAQVERAARPAGPFAGVAEHVFER